LSQDVQNHLFCVDNHQIEIGLTLKHYIRWGRKKNEDELTLQGSGPRNDF